MTIQLKRLINYAFMCALACCLCNVPLLAVYYAETYQEFKEDLYAEEIAEDYSLYEKLEIALEGVKKYSKLSQRKKNGARHQQKALYYYNFAREEAGLALASDYSQIDTVWLENQIYAAWKEFGKTIFSKADLSLIEKQYFLLQGIHLQLFFAKINNVPYKTMIQENKTILYSYNYARELEGKEPIQSVEEWDQDWFENLSKATVEMVVSNPLLRQKAKAISLADTFSTDSSLSDQAVAAISMLNVILKHVDTSKTSHEAEIAFNAYNHLRGILHLEPIISYSDMSYEWLESITNESMPFILKNAGYEPSDDANKALFAQLKKEVGIEEELIVLKHNDEFNGVTANGVVGFSDSLDMHDKLFVVYHELAHAYYRDTKTLQDLFAGKVNYQDLLGSEALRSIDTQITSCLDKGKKALTTSNPLGKHLLAILEKTPVLWQKPNEENAYLLQQLGRYHEQRADLFALEKLYEKQDVDSIITWINNMAFGLFSDGEGYAVVTSHDPHPSDVERALYAIGFLAEKHIDVNQAYNDWLENGTCSPSNIAESALVKRSDREEGSLALLHNESAIEKAFSARLNNPEHYKAVKDDWEKNYKDYDFTPVTQQKNVLSAALTTLEELEKKYSEDLAENVFHNYNYARELFNRNTITSLQAIDKEWLLESYTQTWQRAQEEKPQEQFINDLTREAMADFTFAALDDPSMVEIESRNSKHLLVAYNALRAVFSLPKASSIEEVDLKWLKDKAYTQWKKEILDLLEEIQATTLAQKLMWLSSRKQANSYDTLESFYCYNLIRDLLQLPRANYIDQMDYEWLSAQEFYKTCAYLKPNLNDLFYDED